MKTTLVLACLVTLAAGCASPITKQDQASLAQPINCSTAVGDLRVLLVRQIDHQTDWHDGRDAVRDFLGHVGLLGLQDT